MTKQPTQHDIEHLLDNITAQPSERFYEKMENAPWNDTPATQNSVSAKAIYPRVAAVAATLLLGGLLFTPLGTLAQDIISQFFFQLPGNTQSNTITVDMQPTAAADARVVQPQSLQAVQSQVDFQIAVPEDTRGFTFSDAETNTSGSATQTLLFYMLSNDTVGRNIVIKQAPASFGFGGVDIGANAVVEHVQIGDVVGEYTRGFWAKDTSPEVVAENGTEQTLELEQTWDNSLGFQFLRWERDGMAYEIMFQESPNAMFSDYVANTSAPGYLTRDDLVMIAASMQR